MVLLFAKGIVLGKYELPKGIVHHAYDVHISIQRHRDCYVAVRLRIAA